MTLEFIEPWITNPPENLGKLLSWVEKLGFSGCIIEGINSHEFKNFKQSLQLNSSFSTFTRTTIDSNKKNPPALDQLRTRHEFMTYYCTNAELTKWACQDQRIDNLLFPLKEIHRLVDDSTINMAKENDKSIEIDFSLLIADKYPIAQLRNIIKVVHRVTKKEIPLIFSSRANSINMVRSPYSLLGFLNFIGLPENYYKEISQKWLVQRLTRNVSRNSNSFVSPGIWVTSENE